ncbi:MAG: fused MFS/spermidine synthase [Candidatus Omnitrophica bacterium]|nr:fused MFS/spermidine synthase [Candidatus Omnitrophota bacterium]
MPYQIVLPTVITFLSAFLLFQIELIVAKMLLPNYGGSYLVWGASVVFFQAVLFLGYLFAQYGIDKWGIEKYKKIHVVLVFLPFLFFPGRNLTVSYAHEQVPLVLDVFLQLLSTVGPVFFVLSTISVVWQVWLSRSELPQRKNPYVLYAVSNLGSFAALFTYPFIFELHLDVNQQLLIWRLAYLVFALLNALGFVWIKARDEVRSTNEESLTVTRLDVIKWLLLSSGGVVMFLSVTNIMTYEVTPVPLVWIIPLGIYLMAFVLNFKARPWCPRWIVKGIPIILALSAMLFFMVQQIMFPAVISLVLLCGSLFLLCMYCQHELMANKPKSHRSLALFYVVISLGSFLGGVITSWIVPLISINTFEYLIGLFLIAAVRVCDKRGSKQGVVTLLAAGAWTILLFVWPKIFSHFSLIGIAILVAVISWVALELNRSRWALTLALLVVACVSSYLEPLYKRHDFIYKMRNYYGIYEVYNGVQMRTFLHGTTLHGVQLLEGEYRNIPLGYYSPTSAVGQVMIENQSLFRRVALIGLGAGTLTAYGNSQQSFDIYELDPDVFKIAKKYFSYMDVSGSRNKYIFGDARMSLEKNTGAVYDAIVVDAFGGDSIPGHLVNLDMIQKYRRHMTESGMILFHATNRYLNLEPVLSGVANKVGAYVASKDVPDGGFNLRSLWVVMTWDKKTYEDLTSKKGWRPVKTDQMDRYPVWSDSYSSILPILKLDMLIGAVRSFKFFSW